MSRLRAYSADSQPNLGLRTMQQRQGTLGVYEFYKKLYPSNKKYYDIIPKLLEKKYLKTIHNCHLCAGTIGKGDLDGEGELTVLDIDFILHWRTAQPVFKVMDIC